MTRQILWMFVLFAASGASIRAEDWPCWRGPRKDGTWNAPTLPRAFPKAGPKVVWKKPIGAGYSGISTANGLIFTMDRPKPTDKSKTPDGTERVLCFDGKDGTLVWQHEYAAHYKDLDYGSGPRGNPTVHDGMVYTLGAVGMVNCLDAKSGKVVWSKDMVKEAGSKLPTWGYSASPLIVDEKVIVHTGAQPNGCIVALNRRTGDEIWRSISDPAGYSTPLLIDSPSGRQIIIWTPTHINGVDPSTGKHLWSIDYPVTYGVSIATPIYAEGLVFVAGYWEGSKAIRLGKAQTEATIAWTDEKQLRGLMSPPLYRDGHVYLLDKGNGFTCFELKTGVKKWDDDNKLTPRGRNPQANFVWIDDSDRVLGLNANGELILARFQPTGYKEESRAKIIGETWANPGFMDKFVFARSDTEIVCVCLTE